MKIKIVCFQICPMAKDEEVLVPGRLSTSEYELSLISSSSCATQPGYSFIITVVLMGKQSTSSMLLILEESIAKVNSVTALVSHSWPQRVFRSDQYREMPQQFSTTFFEARARSASWQKSKSRDGACLFGSLSLRDGAGACGFFSSGPSWIRNCSAEALCFRGRGGTRMKE